MYLIEKLKIFFGSLVCADDHSDFKVVSECSLMLRKRTLVKKGGHSAWLLVVSERISKHLFWFCAGHIEY